MNNSIIQQCRLGNGKFLRRKKSSKKIDKLPLTPPAPTPTPPAPIPIPPPPPAPGTTAVALGRPHVNQTVRMFATEATVVGVPPQVVDS